MRQRRIIVFATCDYENSVKKLEDMGYSVFFSFREGLDNNPIYSFEESFREFENSPPDAVLIGFSERFRWQLASEFSTEDEDFMGMWVGNSHKDHLRKCIGKVRTNFEGPIILLPPPPVVQDPLGINGYRLRKSPRERYLEFLFSMYEVAREEPGVFIVDSDKEILGAHHFISYTDLYNFQHPQHQLIEVQTSLIDRKIRQANSRDFKKWICLDLDNTLWDGIWIEDGPSGISLRKNRLSNLLSLIERGFIIAVTSKNNEEEIEEIKTWIKNQRTTIEGHCEKFVENIVSWEVNWNPKSSNISRLSKQLELSIKHCVFIDDNPVERHEVSEVLGTEILVMSETEFDLSYSRMDEIWETVSDGRYTDESGKRSQMYIEESTRKLAEGEEALISHEDSLVSLNIEYSVFEPTENEIPRIVELLARTNRQNVMPERPGEIEVKSYMTDPNRVIRCLRAKDRFGEYGLIGICMFNNLEIDYQNVNCNFTHLSLSCRLMGKDVELTFLSEAFDEVCKFTGCETINAEINGVITDKNRPFLKKLQQSSHLEGYSEISDREFKAILRRQ